MNKNTSVGIMTFHWATNYGAVLQAWALQQYIKELGYNVEIINYVPSNYKINLFRCFKTRHLKKFINRYKEYRKEKKIRVFRKARLNVSPKEYNSKIVLKNSPPLYDIYVSGSDQIWNPFFTMNGQKGITLSYYLDFAPHDRRRIAFSSSFGLKEIPDSVKSVIVSELKKYYRISTRETEGVKILESININAVTTIDPTLLLDAKDYYSLFEAKQQPQNNLFTYFIHNQKETALGLISYIKDKYQLNEYPDEELIIEKWLERISNSRIVITNSYHCLIFCLIFHVPFYIVDVDGVDMSPRITTLLKTVNLEERFLHLPLSPQNIQNCSVMDNILWKDVDTRLNSARTYSKRYLQKALSL